MSEPVESDRDVLERVTRYADALTTIGDGRLGEELLKVIAGTAECLTQPWVTGENHL